MSFVVIFLGIVVALFAVVFFTRRRFGILGLALAAGAILSNLWVGDLTPIIAGAGVVVVKPPLESVIATGLTLLPAVILLASGPTHKGSIQRAVGAAAFAVLAVALLLEPLSVALVIDAAGKPLYDFFAQYRAIIITMCLIFAVGDILLTKHAKRHRETS